MGLMYSNSQTPEHRILEQSQIEYQTIQYEVDSFKKNKGFRSSFLGRMCSAGEANDWACKGGFWFCVFVDKSVRGRCSSCQWGRFPLGQHGMSMSGAVYTIWEDEGETQLCVVRKAVLHPKLGFIRGILEGILSVYFHHQKPIAHKSQRSKK